MEVVSWDRFDATFSVLVKHVFEQLLLRLDYQKGIHLQVTRKHYSKAKNRTENLLLCSLGLFVLVKCDKHLFVVIWGCPSQDETIWITINEVITTITQNSHGLD